MKRKESIRKLKAQVWALFSEYIRKRDCLRTTGSLEWGECITCDGHFTFDQLQAGHFIPGRHNANLFSERGVHAQCVSCNRYHGGRPLEYRRQIIKLYGEGSDEELEKEARATRKFTISELRELKEYYKSKLEEVEKG